MDAAFCFLFVEAARNPFYYVLVDIDYNKMVEKKLQLLELFIFEYQLHVDEENYKHHI